MFSNQMRGGLKCHYTNPFVPYRVHFYLLSLMQPNLTLLLLIRQQIELHLTAACGAADDRICSCKITLRRYKQQSKYHKESYYNDCSVRMTVSAPSPPYWVGLSE